MASDFDAQFAAATPSFLSVFGDTGQVAPADAGGSYTYRNIEMVVHGDARQNLDEGNTVLQYMEVNIEISSRNNTEGKTAIKCHGDVNGDGGDRFKLPGDSSTVWYPKEVLNDGAGGFWLIRVVNNPGQM